MEGSAEVVSVGACVEGSAEVVAGGSVVAGAALVVASVVSGTGTGPVRGAAERVAGELGLVRVTGRGAGSAGATAI